MDRRSFLTRAGAAAAAGPFVGALPLSPAPLAAEETAAAGTLDLRKTGRATTPAGARGWGAQEWEDVRAHFELDPEWVHMAGLLLASHPTPVREAIARHRRELDENPALYWMGERFEAEAREAAADYLAADPGDIALTDSTTMGLATLYNGLDLGPGDEILTTEHDHHATHQSLEYKAERSGASIRRVRLYQVPGQVGEGVIVDRIAGRIRPETRVVAVTWVHSSSGVRLPIRRIADALAEVNASRDASERVLLCVDGVHGFGVEDVTVEELGCDFLAAGTHKWLFGPRGTGVLWGRPEAQDRVSPTIPSFSGWATWGQRMTPGGFHSFEHRWALPEAFRFHMELGKDRVEARIHALNRRMKEGLAEMPHVTLYTPPGDALSSGITCFDVDGLSERQTVARLRERGVIASTTPYARSYARVTPGLINGEEDVERTLEAIGELG